MGRRGPAPLPTEVLARRGSWRAKLPRNEPQPEPGAPACPEWLSEDAKAKWNELMPMLVACGMITKIDVGPLARYCDAWVRWVAAAKFLSERGEMYPLKDNKGNVKCFMQFPQVSSYHNLAAMLVRLEQELGLTPSTRSRLDTKKIRLPTQEDAKIAEFKQKFFGPRPAG